MTPTCLCLIPAAEFASLDELVRYSRRSNVPRQSPSRPPSRSIESESWETTSLTTLGVLGDCYTWPKSFFACAIATRSQTLCSCQSVKVLDPGISVMTEEGGRGDEGGGGLRLCVHPVRGIPGRATYREMQPRGC